MSPVMCHQHPNIIATHIADHGVFGEKPVCPEGAAALRAAGHPVKPLLSDPQQALQDLTEYQQGIYRIAEVVRADGDLPHAVLWAREKAVTAIGEFRQAVEDSVEDERAGAA